MADATRAALESGNFAAGENTLADRLAGDPDNGEARIGLGIVRFAEAVEHFGQAQYRYGLRTDAAALPLSFVLPFAPPGGFAPPTGPDYPVQRLSYDQQRAVLQGFLDDLRRVDEALAPLGKTQAKVALDLNAIQFRIAPDAPLERGLTLGALLRAAQSPNGRGDAADEGAPFEAVFDRADAIWLRAYTHMISAALEFALAYDWRDSFDRYGGLFYWGAKAPPQPYEKPDLTPSIFGDQLFDLIGFVHSIRWRCIEPDRVRAVKRHLKTVASLNRQMWPLVLARSEDEKNWIPGPRQHNSAISSLSVTDEIVKAWQANIETFDSLLDGKALLPHWRYVWGLDLAKVFDRPPDLDFLDWVSGPPTIPYLREGQTIDAAQWRKMTQPFGSNFLPYVIWFN